MNTIFFDLDGTLLPLDENEFIKIYFHLLSKRFCKYGFEQDAFINVIWTSTKAMLNNNGEKTNEQVFWEVFSKLTNLKRQDIESEFEDFYLTEFSKVKNACKDNELAIKCVKKLKEKGYQLILATNPVFPLVSTTQRILWAGLNPTDFTYISTFENSSYCKPHPGYYQSILRTINQAPEECMMVGNSVKEDMVTHGLGFKTFLLTDYLINHDNEDIQMYKNGSFLDLLKIIEALPSLK